MARFLARLVRRVFLRALVIENVAEAGRKVQGPLLAVQDGGERPERRRIGEGDHVRLGLQMVAHVVELQRAREPLRQDHGVRHVEGLVEVDVLLVQRVPEMVMGGADDLVERRGAGVVAVERQHGLEVVRRHGFVEDVLGDVAVSGHDASLTHKLHWERTPCHLNSVQSIKMTEASFLRPRRDGLTRAGLDGVDLRVGQPEVVTDLVHQNVGDQFLEGDLALFRPLVEDRAPVEEHHGRSQRGA